MRAPYWSSRKVTLYHGDNREVLAELAAEGDAAVALTVTSPPYPTDNHDQRRAT